MRKLTDHEVNGLNEAIEILVVDERGQGNANHHYQLLINKTLHCDINFQCGPIKEAMINGISQEALLAIVIDRLRGFQAGQYACRENAIALTKIEEGLMWLQKRTRDRIARGVEGENKA